jgi:hypothetical protein
MHSPIAALVTAEAVVPRVEALVEGRARRSRRRAARRAGRRPTWRFLAQPSAFRVRRSAIT